MSENLLRWNPDRSRYEWHGGYNTKHLVDRTGAQFMWDPKFKKWWTKLDDCAAKLSGYADDATVKRLSGVIKVREQAYEDSRAVDASIDPWAIHTPNSTFASIGCLDPSDPVDAGVDW